MTAVMRPEKARQTLARSNRRRLTRLDGRVYLNRWGFESPWFGGSFIHHFTAPDPSLDLHDHPWWFVSVILKGGYTEVRCPTRLAVKLANFAESIARGHGRNEIPGQRGLIEHRRWLSWRLLRLDECHRILALDGPECWSLVIHGPNRREWGFYTPAGRLEQDEYDRTVGDTGRGVSNDIRSASDRRSPMSDVT